MGGRQRGFPRRVWTSYTRQLYALGPVGQGSFVWRWELSAFLSAHETASSPSAQPHMAFDFLPVISYLSFCQMIHCRPAEFICTKMFQFWTVSHHLLRRDCLILNELQESQKPNPDTFQLHRDVASAFQHIHLGMCDSGQ